MSTHTEPPDPVSGEPEPPMPVGTPADPGGPAGIYAARLADRQALLDRLRRHDGWLSNARLAVFVAGAAVAWFVLGARTLGLAWLLPPTAVFAALLLVHDRVIRRREVAERAVAYLERGIARLEYRFAGLGCTEAGFTEPHHPYAIDLDLFGAGSLFERVCEARTRAGQERLAGWLLAGATPDEVRARQEAVRELAQDLDLREELALLGDDLRDSVEPEALRTWGTAPPEIASPVHRFVAPVLVALTLAAGFLWFRGAGPLPFVVALMVQAGYAGALRTRVVRVISAVGAPSRDLDVYAGVLELLERASFEAPLLRALQERLRIDGVPPSRRIRRLHRWVELLDARRNQFFAPVAVLLLWATQLAFALERWRRQVGPRLGDWVDAIATFEALSSLAGHAFEEPGFVYPELVDRPCFEANELGHPLIPPDRRVPNDVALGGDPGVFVVSGSNMSGKSTLLRSVGAAAVLGQAGAPVCAASLVMSPLRVGASIQVVDSLMEGASHFYAEIQRVRQVMEIAEDPPEGGAALFLLDEIFHGTNSHDRGIGAEAVVRGLLSRGALGLVTTHDLALARVADGLAPRARNVHFEDHLDGEGRIAFDYRMREGIVTRSNALALMRAVGLPV